MAVEKRGPQVVPGSRKAENTSDTVIRGPEQRRYQVSREKPKQGEEIQSYQKSEQDVVQDPRPER